MTHMPVIAVVPHYNMPRTLGSLLRQLAAQDYSAVYVLDDHSTNCRVEEIVAPFGPKVRLIAANENVGAAGNRNRILQAAPQQLQGSILHFIDSDCELVSKNIPAAARRIFEANPDIGAVGGLILNADNSYFEYNYFPRISWMGGISGVLVGIIIAAGSRSPSVGRRVRQVVRRALADFPDPRRKPVAKNVFAFAEANMLIPYTVLLEIGGFEAKLRFGEAQDLAYKLEAKGWARRFDPAIIVKHHAVQLLDRKRGRYLIRANYRLARKYGLPFK